MKLLLLKVPRRSLRLYQKRSRPFPDELGKLEGAWIAEQTLQVPGTDGQPYRYYGPKGKNGILVAGHPNGPDGGICVLTTELQMMRLSPKDLDRRLAPPK